MNETMYFYCPECGKEDKEFKFKNRKEEELLRTWTNIRDGYGQFIRHIKCPDCGNVLSGLMRYRSSYGNITDQQRYFKSVIEMYNKESKDGGMILDGELEKLKKKIEGDYNAKIENIKRADEMIKLGKRCIWGCNSCGKFMRFNDYEDKPKECMYCGSTDII